MYTGESAWAGSAITFTPTDSGTMNSYARIGIFGILTLVALRVGIGWHFYMEGATKVRGQNFSSVGFLNAAKGPLADEFQAMIWDHDGKIRLDSKRMEALIDSASESAKKHFAYTDEQLKDVSETTERTKSKLTEVYSDASSDVQKYLASQERLERMESSKMYSVSSLSGQRDKVKSELLSSVKPTMDSVDAVITQFEQRLNDIANSTQKDSVGRFQIVRPESSLLSTQAVDKIIPIFDMVIGILLIIGLLTPIASIAGDCSWSASCCRRCLVTLAHNRLNFQAVEALAMFALAGTDAGRYAGLDFLPWAWWQRGKAAAVAPAA